MLVWLARTSAWEHPEMLRVPLVWSTPLSLSSVSTSKLRIGGISSILVAKESELTLLRSVSLCRLGCHAEGRTDGRSAFSELGCARFVCSAFSQYVVVITSWAKPGTSRSLGNARVRQLIEVGAGIESALPSVLEISTHSLRQTS